MRANYYIIDGVNERFETLADAKYHIYVSYTPNERIKWFGDDSSYICGISAKTEDVVSVTRIKVDANGRESFGKTVRY